MVDFANYSQEARRILFMARVEAGWLGGPIIDVDHLLAGIVLQDQNDVAGVLLRLGERKEAGNESRPTMGTAAFFFSAEVAALVLESVEEAGRLTAVPKDDAVPLSDDLKRVLTAADHLALELHHTQLKPLHLLVAALDAPSSRGAEVLRKRGITRQTVMEELRDK
jgi:ATP-dependent Clp protease ATP-binding subunit ClpA